MPGGSEPRKFVCAAAGSAAAEANIPNADLLENLIALSIHS
jgi:hypothetical protein